MPAPPIRMADGDGRAVLTLAEEVWRAARPGEIFGQDALFRIVQRAGRRSTQGSGRPLQSDFGAAQPVRGSGPDAALYYLCRMLDAGEDPLFIGRWLVRMAVEDIGR